MVQRHNLSVDNGGLVISGNGNRSVLRKVVGWAMSNRIKASLATDALSMAYWRRKPEKGLIHHSDRGSQYAGGDYQNLLGNYGMICSMSRKGDCWDNAVAESFFHSMKTESTSVCFIVHGAMREVM